MVKLKLLSKANHSQTELRIGNKVSDCGIRMFHEGVAHQIAAIADAGGLAVAEHKNFTLAAEKCFVTQPTLSMQIHKVEEELGVKIFDRSKQPVIATELGAELIEQARKIIAEKNKGKLSATSEGKNKGAEFKIVFES